MIVRAHAAIEEQRPACDVFLTDEKECYIVIRTNLSIVLQTEGLYGIVIILKFCFQVQFFIQNKRKMDIRRDYSLYKVLKVSKINLHFYWSIFTAYSWIIIY